MICLCFVNKLPYLMTAFLLLCYSHHLSQIFGCVNCWEVAMLSCYYPLFTSCTCTVVCSKTVCIFQFCPENHTVAALVAVTLYIVTCGSCWGSEQSLCSEWIQILTAVKWNRRFILTCIVKHSLFTMFTFKCKNNVLLCKTERGWVDCSTGNRSHVPT